LDVVGAVTVAIGCVVGLSKVPQHVVTRAPEEKAPA
jgi:hypothetical protein